MKKLNSLFFLLPIVSLLILFSCKKNTTPMSTIQVRDAINNSAVAGVNVGIHRCGIYDPLCGIIAYRSSTTGADGYASFTQEDFGQAQTVTAVKAGYWLAFEPKPSYINFYPDGWLRMRIVRSTTYPAGAMLRIMVKYLPANKSNGIQVNPAADSSILIRSYGGAANQVEWFVETTSPVAQLNSGSFSQNIPRQDTVNVTLNY